MQLAVLDSSVDLSAVRCGGWRWQPEWLLGLQPAVVDVPWRWGALKLPAPARPTTSLA
jgi:hypothetical protein